MTAAITPTQRKSRGYLTLDKKIGKNLKKENKDITFDVRTRTYKAYYAKTNQSYYVVVIPECTSWNVHAMVDILTNQRKKY